ncbi:leukemia inhibitory factor [Dendropsophus ebraccatus]|uniref:leukemia inhibitory factor n=1 Tax=Dendropsophus ebraccatus TaxID=150705 RepID=UPI00383194C7
MQLVAGVVQLLIFQHLALLMARAKPINDVSSLHTHASICNDSITSIMSQIHSLIMDMHLKAKERFDTYAHYQRLDAHQISSLCHAEHSEFPKFSLNRTGSEEEKLSELYKIFQYMSTAMGNITKEQEKDLNSNNRILHKQLNTSKEEIAAVISNLSCVLNKRYKAPKIEVYYKVSRKTWHKKINGCKVLHKYRHFLTQAANITGDWGNNGEYTQDLSSDKLTPYHR